VRAFADDNGNGIRDGTEVQHQTVSDERGRYRLSGLEPQKQYRLYQDLPFGWRDITQANLTQADLTQALTTQVIGGGDVPAGAYPFVVSLQFARGDDFIHYCGASLISERWLLTAAHCAPRADEVAYLGANQLLPSDDPAAGIRVAFEQIIIHPRFRTERSGFDVALVRLARPVNLPTLSLASVTPATSEAYVVGWGDTASGAQVYSDSLQDVDVSLLAAASCWQFYEDNAPLLAADITNQDTQRCAGRTSGGVDACQGDSGGPLLVRSTRGWLQVGISSWGLGCAFAGLPGVYSNVPALHDWIISNAVEPAPVHLVSFAEGSVAKDSVAENNVVGDTTDTVTFDLVNLSTLNPYRNQGFIAVRDFMADPTFPATVTPPTDIAETGMEAVTFTWQVDGNSARCTLDVDDDGSIERVLEPCTGNQQFIHNYAQPGLYRAVLRVSDGDTNHTRRLLVNASQPTAINLGERISGELSVSDSTSHARRQTFSDYFVLSTANISTDLRIVLTNETFEAILYVLDGNWRTLANSIDGTPDDNHAEVSLPSPLPETLIIAVTSKQPDELGAYQLITALTARE